MDGGRISEEVEGVLDRRTNLRVHFCGRVVVQIDHSVFEVCGAPSNNPEIIARIGHGVKLG
jgi:hypothetical protein